MDERERDIKKMNQDLLLVNEMFRAMAQIVDKQGTMITMFIISIVIIIIIIIKVGK
jgi:hypothetical protein